MPHADIKGLDTAFTLLRPATIMENRKSFTDYEVHGAARSDIGKALSVIERLDAPGVSQRHSLPMAGIFRSFSVEGKRRRY